MLEYVAVVLAAGTGKRMDIGENKQFLGLMDTPLIIHTLTVFEEDRWCKAIILVAQPIEQERMRSLISCYTFATSITIIAGGKERQDSAYNGLLTLSLLHPANHSLVFIHDGARPFVKEEHLHQLAKVVTKKRAALLAVPVTDTIKERNGEQLKTIDRSTLWAAQTPQGFHFDLIWEAHHKAREAVYTGTDDVSLVERLGYPVEIVEGSYSNIKLTTPEDIARACGFLKKD